MREGGGENLHRWVTWWNRRCLTQHPAHRQQQQPLFLKWASFDSWDQQTIGNDGAFALLPSMASDGWRRVVVSCGSRQTCPTISTGCTPLLRCLHNSRSTKKLLLHKGPSIPGTIWTEYLYHRVDTAADRPPRRKKTTPRTRPWPPPPAATGQMFPRPVTSQHSFRRWGTQSLAAYYQPVPNRCV
jgi:hypothetical protein